MWLINTNTLELKHCVSERGVEYAILSHTWGNDEVNHQDFRARSRTTRRKQGYVKIQRACEEAQKAGLQYAWVDTCCIDKTSSAELSEAINSMFRWYQNAQVCHVYMDDVLTGGDGWPLQADLFRMSRWFTRGWTLQELIAPKAVRFYDKAWKFMTNLLDQVDLISVHTRIDKQLLLGQRNLSSFSVAARMSWAALRSTTRIEDQAYCLMGIFSVNMPLLYGEGTEAFRRLQEEIFRSSPDLSMLAWPHYIDLYVRGWDIMGRSIAAHDKLVYERLSSANGFRVLQKGVGDIFAPSPLFFKSMDDLVLDPRIDSVRPCVLSSTSLELCVRHVKEPGGPDVEIVLGCRRTKDLGSMPVLRLKPTDSNHIVDLERLAYVSLPLNELHACRPLIIQRGVAHLSANGVTVTSRSLPQLWLWLPADNVLMVRDTMIVGRYDSDAQIFQPRAGKETIVSLRVHVTNQYSVVEVVVSYDDEQNYHLYAVDRSTDDLLPCPKDPKSISMRAEARRELQNNRKRLAQMITLNAPIASDMRLWLERHDPGPLLLRVELHGREHTPLHEGKPPPATQNTPAHVEATTSVIDVLPSSTGDNEYLERRFILMSRGLRA